MAFSTLTANSALDTEFTGTLYLALYTTNPTAADTGTEATGGSYARQAITFTAAAAGQIASTADISFTVDIATYTHYAIHSAVTAGDMLDYGELNGGSDIVVSVDDTEVNFTAGVVTVSISTGL